MSSEPSLDVMNIGLIVSTLGWSVARISIKVSAMVLTAAEFLGTVLTIPVIAGDESLGCTRTVRPAEMQRHIQTDDSSWRLQDVSTLSGNAKEPWQSEKPVG